MTDPAALFPIFSLPPYPLRFPDCASRPLFVRHRLCFPFAAIVSVLDRNATRPGTIQYGIRSQERIYELQEYFHAMPTCKGAMSNIRRIFRKNGEEPVEAMRANDAAPEDNGAFGVAAPEDRLVLDGAASSTVAPPPRVLQIGN